VHGSLGEKLLADIVRELGETRASGLLRLTQGKTIKAIFFETGSPVFAISNLSQEQIDFHLVQQRCATRAQVDEALKEGGKMHRIGQTLVEKGVIDSETMRRATRQLAKEIVLSLFEWTSGEFVFDERMKAEHSVKLDWNASDCILEGTRAASRLDQFAHSVAPEGYWVSRSKKVGTSNGFAGKLDSIESYLLSRLETPTRVEELASISGLGQEETRKALCALVSVGLLRARPTQKPSPEQGESAAVADPTIVDEITRKLDFFPSADCYEILGVTKRSTSSDVKAAYYKLAKKFHPDKFRQPEHKEIHAKVERLFSKITEAYETLIDPASRASYDEQSKKGVRSEPAPEPVAMAEPLAPRRDNGPLSVETNSGSLPEAHPAPSPIEPSKTRQQPVSNPAQAAEYYYQQGRTRNDQRDHYGAVIMLREAVKLDPKKPHYHFHLGVALLKNPRTRREAEVHLVKAAELDPFNSQIRLRLAFLYKEAGLPKKAEHYFREALSLDPENLTAQRELSGTRSRNKNDVPIWKADIGTIAKKFFRK
jgi:curved DNA-binding protein CbpA